MTRDEIIVDAFGHGITLFPEDFTEDDGWCIDGQPAEDWLKAMTME